MIINTIPPTRSISNTNKMIDQLVKGRIEKKTNEVIDEIDKVIGQLTNCRRLYKTILIECPDFDVMIKNQIDELKRINNGLKKEVM